MGSPEGELGRSTDETRHRVRVSGFAMASYPVTQKLFQEVMEQSPSHFKGELRPVDRVSWFDAVRFCNKLSVRMGLRPCYRIVVSKRKQTVDAESATKTQLEVQWDQTTNGYRLPTEAEWEYACRAGTETAYSFDANPSLLGEYAWFVGNSKGRTHTVGLKQPNGWGLYDLHGNVWEWCWDWYADYSVTSDNDKGVILTGPTGPATGHKRVLRGGSFSNEPKFLRSADRFSFMPEDQTWFLGFRCVRGSGRPL